MAIDRPDHGGAVGGRPAAAESGAEILEQRLGEEVVRGRVGQRDERRHPRRMHDGQRLRVGRRDAGLHLDVARQLDPRALQRGRELLPRFERRVGDQAVP